MPRSHRPIVAPRLRTLRGRAGDCILVGQERNAGTQKRHKVVTQGKRLHWGRFCVAVRSRQPQAGGEDPPQDALALGNDDAGTSHGQKGRF